MKLRWSLKSGKSRQITSDYLSRILNPVRLRSTIEEAADILSALRRHIPFDALAFRGNSGAGIAFPLSAIMCLPLIMVRKGNSHSRYKVEGALNAASYIIVDDLIHSGNTIDVIVREIRRHSHSHFHSVPVGIYLYNQSGPRFHHVGSKKIPVINRRYLRENKLLR